jgi:PKD repeat protein
MPKNCSWHPIALALTLTLSCGLIPLVAQGPTTPSSPTGLRVQRGRVLDRGLDRLATPVQPPLAVHVDRSDVYVAELVTVTLEPEDRIVASRFLFTVDFGDGNKGTKPLNSAQVLHRYREVGRYTIAVSVSGPPNETFDALPSVPNTVAVNVAAPPLSAAPAVAAVSEPITFTTPFPADDPAIRLRLTFDDGKTTEWMQVTDTVHAYDTAGTYTPSAEVGVLDDGEIFPAGKTAPTSVQVAQAALGVTNAGSLTDATRFTVRFPSQDPALRYRVNFGDNSLPSEWSVNSDSVHAYQAAGTYQPFAEIGRATAAGVTLVAASAPVALQIVQSPIIFIPPKGDGGSALDWLPYLLVGLVFVAAGYGVKQIVLSPHPSFSAHRGPGDSRVDTPDGDVHVQMEVRFHAGTEEGQASISTGTTPLISDFRRVL